MTSDLLTKVRPPISKQRRRPLATSFAIACLETPRIREASAWLIHSPGSNVSAEWVDKGNLLVLKCDNKILRGSLEGSG
jgi:hypothetical protein